MEPHTFTDAYAFGIDGDDVGGHLFRCPTKQDCDTLIANMEARRPISGQYVYQSASGTTVVRLGSYLDARAALWFADAIRDLP